MTAMAALALRELGIADAVPEDAHCPYCGEPARRGALTCDRHKGLVRLDPYYSTARAPRRELHRV